VKRYDFVVDVRDIVECDDGDYVRWDDVKGIVDAKERLESACDLYVRWYGTGEPEMGGGAMAYEMVCFIRQALAALEGKAA
jgi:hypothetical protein